MKVYSPSQTSEWIVSPLVRWLRYKERWVPRQMGRNDLAAIVGTAVAAGMAFYHQTKDGDSFPREAARIAAMKELDHHLRNGRTLPPESLDAMTKLPLVAEGIVTRAIANDPIPPSWEIRHVEATLPDHGHCRIDLGVMTPAGPVVIDYKVKMSLEAKRLPWVLQDYDYSWQLYHYAWAYGEYVGEKVNQCYIRLLPAVKVPSIEPIMHPVAIDDEMMALWRQSSEDVWARMEQDDENGHAGWWDFKTSTQFGRSPYANAITLYKMEPTLMEAEYVRLPRREKT